MRVVVISFTEKGDIINRKITCLKNLFDSSTTEFMSFGKGDGFLKMTSSVYEWAREYFYKCDILFFVGAVGIAVRAVSPLIKEKSKKSDPAVIVCDELGKFVIPILSGHIGGGNFFALKTSEFLGAEAVITTATDINNIWAVDIWAKNSGYIIDNVENIKYISAALLRNEKVGIFSDFPVVGELPHNVSIGNHFDSGIVISVDKYKKVFKNNLNIVPKCLYLGVGSRKNVEENSLIELIENIFKKNGFIKNAVIKIGTIDLKKNEKAVLKLAEYFNCELIFFSAEELNSASGNFSKSEFVKKVTGCDNVCERAAVCLSKGKIIVPKTVFGNVTAAIAVGDWSVNFENYYGRN